MTTSPTQPSSIKPVVVVCHPDSIQQAIAVMIRWEISRQAIAPHAPTPTGTAHTLILELTASQSPDSFQTKWTLTDPATNAQCPLNHPCLANTTADQITIDRNDTHLVILNTTHTQAVIKHDLDKDPNKEPTLLLARTTLFGTLEIAGGRYKPLSAGCHDSPSSAQ